MAVARKLIDKKLLHNVIRNTDAHNKIEEEKIMWRLHRIQNSRDYSKSSSRQRNTSSKALPRDDDSCQVPGSRFWMKELTSYENSLSDRWGHSGYEELYPEEFQDKTNESCSDEDYHKKRKLRRKKKKKERKTKDREGKRKRAAKKKKSTSPDKIHTKRKSKKEHSRQQLVDKRYEDSKISDGSFKASKITKKDTSKKRRILDNDRSEDTMKRRKTKHE